MRATLAYLLFTCSSVAFAAESSKSAVKLTPKQEFDAAVAAVRAEKYPLTPDCSAVIAAALKLESYPAVPKEAKAAFAEAALLHSQARSMGEFNTVWTAYYEARKLAPWNRDVYYNFGVLSEQLMLVSTTQAGRDSSYNAARENLELYLASKPSDAATARARLMALKGKYEGASAKTMEAAARGEDPGGEWLDQSGQQLFAVRGGVMAGVKWTGAGCSNTRQHVVEAGYLEFLHSAAADCASPPAQWTCSFSGKNVMNCRVVDRAAGTDETVSLKRKP